MARTRFAATASDLRSALTANGIKEPMWSGFQWSCKMGGEHIRQTQAGEATFELRIRAEGKGYAWSFKRV